MEMTNPILMALKDYGTTEIVGPEHNVKIINYFKEIGQSWVTNDEMAWCSAFVNAILKRCNLPYTGKLNARSFLELGQSTQEPELGDIVVLWRVEKDSPFGHVGFFIGKDTSWIYILGGNQSNSVNISKFPIYQVLDYRKLSIQR